MEMRRREEEKQKQEHHCLCGLVKDIDINKGGSRQDTSEQGPTGEENAAILFELETEEEREDRYACTWREEPGRKRARATSNVEEEMEEGNSECVGGGRGQTKKCDGRDPFGIKQR